VKSLKIFDALHAAGGCMASAGVAWHRGSCGKKKSKRGAGQTTGSSLQWPDILMPAWLRGFCPRRRWRGACERRRSAAGEECRRRLALLAAT